MGHGGGKIVWHMSENDFMDGEWKSPSAMLIYDRLWRYRGYHGCKSYCNLRIFLPKHPAPLYVVFTELDSNPGTSVTNRIEHLATSVWRKIPVWNARGRHVKMRVDKIPIWIEHYPNRGLYNPHKAQWQVPESFDFVELHQKEDGSFVNPDWKHTTRVTIETILGREFGYVLDLNRKMVGEETIEGEKRRYTSA
jgi:hypothetical protein